MNENLRAAYYAFPLTQFYARLGVKRKREGRVANGSVSITLGVVTAGSDNASVRAALV